MFGTADLLLRLAATGMTSRAGYRLTRALTPRLGGDRRRWIGSRVEEAARALLDDPTLAAAAGAGFAIEMACDDLDAATALRWPEPRRLASVTVAGGAHLPARGPAVVVSFHLSGGFRVFDVLRARGLAPAFLWAPPRETPSRYQASILRMRTRSLRRSEVAVVSPGPGAREALDRHLAQGGVVVALLDVSPATLELRDHVACDLFGRALELPIGLLRLAARHGAPVIPYAGRLEDDRRVLRFHAPVRDDEPEALLASVLATFEEVIRSQPASWQAWLELDTLFRSQAPV